MARKNVMDIVNEVGETSKELANVITVKMIDVDKLRDHPKNNEDTNSTADLEQSIKEQGFTEPIEVTDFEMEEGEYTIVSGHRRKSAAIKCGIKFVPCIVRKYKSEQEVMNAVLFGNAQRDSGKDDVLLLAKRFAMHNEYLKSINFSGSYREEIARRLGLSPQQADRYGAMNKIILPIWDMIRNDKIGMSSVLSMATLDEKDQEKILNQFEEILKQRERIPRDLAISTIKKFKKFGTFEDVNVPHGEQETEENIINDVSENSENDNSENDFSFEISPSNENEKSHTADYDNSEFEETDMNFEFEELETETQAVNDDTKNVLNLIKACEKVITLSADNLYFGDEKEKAEEVFHNAVIHLIYNLKNLKSLDVMKEIQLSLESEITSLEKFTYFTEE